MKFKILKDGEVINIIVSDETFVTDYCAKNGYTFAKTPTPEPVQEPKTEPTQLDRIEAQVTYTAMMTDTLLEV